ncbi:hypothetical protein ES332_D04G020100v1 [Gossypium tomentosum]|uniref:Uncharacterized protein n=1 Tax=Gossypium tomentosum TaxID=34277 RepID=A0A5D2LBC0_GOSTO|nr:hypothetical protein ES332_D04G020100v1 [Gossypium tomentosum]
MKTPFLSSAAISKSHPSPFSDEVNGLRWRARNGTVVRWPAGAYGCQRGTVMVKTEGGVLQGGCGGLVCCLGFMIS